MELTSHFNARLSRSSVVSSVFTEKENTFLTVNRDGTITRVTYQPKFRQNSQRITRSEVTAMAYEIDNCISSKSSSFGSQHQCLHRIILGTVKGDLIILSKNLELIITLQKKHFDRIVKIQFFDNNNFFMTASYDCSLKIFDAHTYKYVSSFHEHQGFITDFSISPNEKTFITACADQKIRLFDIKKKRCIAIIGPFPFVPTTILFHPEGKHYFIGFTNGVVASYKINNAKKVLSVQLHQGSVTAISLHKSGAFLASVSVDSTISILEVEKADILFSMLVKQKGLNTVRFSDDGWYLMTTSVTGRLTIWDFPFNALVFKTSSKSSVETVNEASSQNENIFNENSFPEVSPLPNNSQTMPVGFRMQNVGQSSLPNHVSNMGQFSYSQNPPNAVYMPSLASNQQRNSKGSIENNLEKSPYDFSDSNSFTSVEAQQVNSSGNDNELENKSSSKFDGIIRANIVIEEEEEEFEENSEDVLVSSEKNSSKSLKSDEEEKHSVKSFIEEEESHSVESTKGEEKSSSIPFKEEENKRSNVNSGEEKNGMFQHKYFNGEEEDILSKHFTKDQEKGQIIKNDIEEEEEEKSSSFNNWQQEEESASSMAFREEESLINNPIISPTKNEEEESQQQQLIEDIQKNQIIQQLSSSIKKANSNNDDDTFLPQKPFSSIVIMSEEEEDIENIKSNQQINYIHYTQHFKRYGEEDWNEEEEENDKLSASVVATNNLEAHKSSSSSVLDEYESQISCNNSANITLNSSANSTYNEIAFEIKPNFTDESFSESTQEFLQIIASATPPQSPTKATTNQQQIGSTFWNNQNSFQINKTEIFTNSDTNESNLRKFKNTTENHVEVEDFNVVFTVNSSAVNTESPVYDFNNYSDKESAFHEEDENEKREKDQKEYSEEDENEKRENDQNDRINIDSDKSKLSTSMPTLNDNKSNEQNHGFYSDTIQFTVYSNKTGSLNSQKLSFTSQSKTKKSSNSSGDGDQVEMANEPINMRFSQYPEVNAEEVPNNSYQLNNDVINSRNDDDDDHDEN